MRRAAPVVVRGLRAIKAKCGQCESLTCRWSRKAALARAVRLPNRKLTRADTQPLLSFSCVCTDLEAYGDHCGVSDHSRIQPLIVFRCGGVRRVTQLT